VLIASLSKISEACEAQKLETVFLGHSFRGRAVGVHNAAANHFGVICRDIRQQIALRVTADSDETDSNFAGWRFLISVAIFGYFNSFP